MNKLTLGLIFAIIALILLIYASCADAQDFKVMSWRNDRWNSTDGILLKSDKLEHAIRDGALYYGCRELKLSVKTSFILTTSFAVAWEVRDGFAWRKTDGFSSKDLLAGVAGQLIVFGVEQLFDKPKSKKYDQALRKASEATLRLSIDGVSISCPDGIAGCTVNHVILTTSKNSNREF